MIAGALTVNCAPGLGAPPAVTTTAPLVAFCGTNAVMLPGVHPVTVAATPLKVTVPWVLPKFEPAMATDVPTEPLLGVKLLIAGGGVLVCTKLAALLVKLPTVTATLLLPRLPLLGTEITIAFVLQLEGVTR